MVIRCTLKSVSVCLRSRSMIIMECIPYGRVPTPRKRAFAPTCTPCSGPESRLGRLETARALGVKAGSRGLGSGWGENGKMANIHTHSTRYEPLTKANPAVALCLLAFPRLRSKACVIPSVCAQGKWRRRRGSKPAVTNGAHSPWTSDHKAKSMTLWYRQSWQQSTASPLSTIQSSVVTAFHHQSRKLFSNQ